MKKQGISMSVRRWFGTLRSVVSVAISPRSASIDSFSSNKVLAGALCSSCLLWPWPATTLGAKPAALTPTDKETGSPYQWIMERHSENPMLRAVPGTWEASWFVVGDVLKMDDKYYMYYCSSDKGNKNSRLGLAISVSYTHLRAHET